MPPAQSDVWKYFTRSIDRKKATCNLCETELTYSGTTTNFRNHLRGKHPSLENNDSDSKKQTSMSSFVSTPKKVSSAESEKITQSIANMIVKDYLPLSIVEGDGFRNLMDNVMPVYKVPCRNTIRSRIVKRYDSERNMLIQSLESVDSVAITTDTWTSNTTESYITVTEHHIDNEWHMHSNVLLTRAMPERHTGENIAMKLKDCVSEFGLEGKVETCVHDNARNMDCAGRKCEDWNDLGCFGHTLQLCIKPALELQNVSKTVAKCRKLVGHFKHSTTLTAEMKNRQVLLGAPCHALMQDVPTRWNSTYLMLQRLYEQRRVLTDIMLDTSVTSKSDSLLLLKDHEWEVISDLCDVLKILTDVTTYMCADKHISCSEVYPIVFGLINGCLKRKECDTGLIVKVKDTIRAEFVTRFQPFSDDCATTVPMLASLLDPKYKRLSFLSADQRKSAHEMLENRIDDVPLKFPSRDFECEPSPKRRKLDFLVFDSPEKQNCDELMCYLAEKISPDVDCLDWWKQNEQRFPKIAHIARRVLAVPATSVPSERIFSATGLLINKLRNRLSCDLVDNIIFLNKNKMCKDFSLTDF